MDASNEIIIRRNIGYIITRLKGLEKTIDGLSKKVYGSGSMFSLDKKNYIECRKVLDTNLRLSVDAIKPSIEGLMKIYGGEPIYDENVVKDDIARVELFIKQLDTAVKLDRLCTEMDKTFSELATISEELITGGLNDG